MLICNHMGDHTIGCWPAFFIGALCSLILVRSCRKHSSSTLSYSAGLHSSRTRLSSRLLQSTERTCNVRAVSVPCCGCEQLIPVQARGFPTS